MTVDQQLADLTRGAIDCISERALRERLESGRALRVKLGIDPTASEVHLGFAVVLRKLRQFQDHGHVAVLILGTFTAQVGDPSERDKTRPRLSAEEVEAHAIDYLAQVTKILDPDPARLEVRRNGEWLGAMGIEDVLELTGSATVAQMLERDDFAQRYGKGSPISITEFLYPLLQGRDSVVVEADVELGGTDQLFNLLVGRRLQEQAGQDPQIVLTTPLLSGVAGDTKMSKSLGNTIGIDDAPAEQFGKLMSIADDKLEEYLTYTTNWDRHELDVVVATLGDGPAARAQAKRRLGRAVADLYHGEGSGAIAEAEFDRVFKEGGAPAMIPAVALARETLGGEVRLAKVLALAGLVASNREGARKITERGVRVNGEVIVDPDRAYSATDLDGLTIQVGKRSWARLVVAERAQSD